tara:strand:- start:5364 stop:5657 length:294 start_codon:yes stop_codon:yes gene_type:complete
MNNELENIYNEDDSVLTTTKEAIKFVHGLKEEANPEQVAFESQLDTIMEEFRTVFPSSINYRQLIVEAERDGSWFDLMHSIWNNHVQPELMERYSNL